MDDNSWWVLVPATTTFVRVCCLLMRKIYRDMTDAPTQKTCYETLSSNWYDNDDNLSLVSGVIDDLSVASATLSYVACFGESSYLKTGTSLKLVTIFTFLMSYISVLFVNYKTFMQSHPAHKIRQYSEQFPLLLSGLISISLVIVTPLTAYYSQTQLNVRAFGLVDPGDHKSKSLSQIARNPVGAATFAGGFCLHAITTFTVDHKLHGLYCKHMKVIFTTGDITDCTFKLEMAAYIAIVLKFVLQILAGIHPMNGQYLNFHMYFLHAWFVVEGVENAFLFWRILTAHTEETSYTDKSQSQLYSIAFLQGIRVLLNWTFPFIVFCILYDVYKNTVHYAYLELSSLTYYFSIVFLLYIYLLFYTKQENATSKSDDIHVIL